MLGVGRCPLKNTLCNNQSIRSFRLVRIRQSKVYRLHKVVTHNQLVSAYSCFQQVQDHMVLWFSNTTLKALSRCAACFPYKALIFIGHKVKLQVDLSRLTDSIIFGIFLASKLLG